jgi:hypothetical protein
MAAQDVDERRLDRIIDRKFREAKDDYLEEFELDEDQWIDKAEDKVLFKRGYLVYVRGTPIEELSQNDQIDLDDGHPPFTFFKRGYLAAEEEGEQNQDRSDDSGNESRARGGYTLPKQDTGMMKQGFSRKFGKK